MNTASHQHWLEYERNQRAWKSKPLLREIYAEWYRHILGLVDQTLPGQMVEMGSALGHLKSQCPSVICTDLFTAPGLDLVCDAYELPFCDNTLSHIILVDVFHHLDAPAAFLKEAHRALVPGGRILLWEPYISWASLLVYGLLHHEPVAWRRPIHLGFAAPPPRPYYAAQGNLTRLAFKQEAIGWASGWDIFHREVMSSFAYLLSGGYSKPPLYPAKWLALIRRCDAFLSRWPRCFGARCLVGLQKIEH